MPENQKKETIGEVSDPENLNALLQKIYNERGYDFREYKKASLQRRIQKRLYDTHVSTYQDYMGLLDRNPDEYVKLFDTLLINVSEFFRDPEAWEIVNSEVLPDILSRKAKGDSIRVWSAGCATGEEAYTTAILLLEKLGDYIVDYDVRIYATDIDEGALNEARKGAYSENKLKNVRPEFLAKYFTTDDSTFRIKRSVRQLVAFGRQDLISDAPISHLDLIICRNVLIYFKTELQSRLIGKFNYALNNDGYIFFGKSESMMVGSRLFTPVNKKWRIFRKTGTGLPVVPFVERRSAVSGEGQVETAVNESRKEFGAMENYSQSIIQSISLAIAVIDPSSVVLTWNKAAEEIFGIRADNAVGRRIFEIGIEDKLPDASKAIEEVLRDKKTVKITDVITNGRKEKARVVDISLVPIAGEGKEKPGFIIIASDVTDKKRIQDELQKTNEDLHTVNEKLETANEELQAANEELETTTEELQSTAEELETSNEELQSTNEELETSNEELRSINEELETTNDELKERTDQLNSIVAYNQSVIQGMRESLIAVDKEGIITIWNPAAVQLWGITSGGAIGRDLNTLLPEIGIKPEDIIGKVRQAMEMKSIYHENEIKYTSLSGRTRHLELDIAPITASTAEVNGAMLLFRDITDEVELRETIVNNNRIVSSIYTMSTLVSRPESMNRTFQDALDIAMASTRADKGSIYLIQDKSPELVLAHSKGLSRSYMESHGLVKIGEGFTGTIAKNGEIFFINSIEKTRHTMSEFAGEGIVSIIGIPLWFKGEMVGVLELYSREAATFSALDMELYVGIGEQLAIAIRIALSPLQELSRVISRSHSIGEIAGQTLEVVQKEYNAKGLWMYLYDRNDNRLKVISSRGFPEGALDKLAIEPGQHLSGGVFQSGELRFLPDISRHSKSMEPEEIAGFEHMPLIVLPLKADDKPIGVLCAYMPDLSGQATVDLERTNLLMIFARHIAQVMDSAISLKSSIC